MSDQIGGSQFGVGVGTDRGNANPAGNIGGQIRDVGAQALDVASGVAGDIQAKASSLLDEMKGNASSAVEDSKGEAAAGLDKLADELHRSSGAFEGQHAWLAKVVESGASEIGSLAEVLRTNDLKAMLGKVEEIARSQPAVFIGAAIAAGFAAARIGRIAAEGATTPTSNSLAAPSTGAARVAS